MVAQGLREELDRGLQLHWSGNVDQAARLYESALAEDPLDADALCLLGIARNQQGRSETAVALIEQAVALRPGIAGFHANLGLAWQSMGRLAESAEEFGKALSLNPDDAAAHVNRGVIVRSLGDTASAVEHFRRAIELQPNLAKARANLGGLLMEEGQPEEALPHCRAAVAIEPTLVEARINLGNALRLLGHLAEARASYLEALRLDPTRGQAAAGLGLNALRQNAWSEALDWLRMAVELDPTSVVFLRYLAEAAADQKLFPEVQNCCERILEIDPQYALAHNVLGFILHEAGRHEEARQRYLKALEVEPGLALAHHNLGVLEEEQGDLAGAAERFRTTLRHEPTHATAMARLTTLLGADTPEVEVEALRQRLAEPELAPIDRANLLFGLAHVHDARNEFADAAACLEHANALALAEQKQTGVVYDPVEFQRMVERILATAPPSFFERLAGAGLDTQRPVFIMGLPRSGTTLLEQILASHPRVHGAGEVPFARRSLEELPALLGRVDEPLNCVAELNAEALGELARRHEDRLRELDGGRCDRIVTKMPENYLHLGMIAVMFPRAVLIHCRRDLRDVAVSCWLKNFNEIRWANHFDHIAGRFAGYRRLMDHWRAVLPSPVHDVDYEETVADLEGVARRLIALCGLEWDPACLEFHRTRRVIRTASLTQVRKPIYRSSLGRWKSYGPMLAELFAKVHSGGDA